MGTALKIRCKHCGAQFNHSGVAGHGFLPTFIGQAEDLGHSETQMAMRCPNCMRRLNNTIEEFYEQIESYASQQ